MFPKKIAVLLSSPVQSVFFSWGMALYFSLILNAPLLIKAYSSFRENHEAIVATPLIIGLFLCLFFIFVALFSIISVKYIEKPVYIILTVISSLLSYGYVYYGVIFNGHSPMIGALEQTTQAEFLSLITPSLLLYILVLGILPSYFIYKTPLRHPPFWTEAWMKAVSFCLYPAFYALTSLPSLPSYHHILCESGLAAHAPFQLIPTNFSEDAFNHYKNRWGAYLPYRHIGVDAKNKSQSNNGKKNLLVFVVGETARSMNYQLNGYKRKTNPYTLQHHAVSFKTVSSCGTSTRISVPCLFSSLPRKEFNALLAEHEDNLLDILKTAHLNVLWIDNNGAFDCQGVCKRVKTIILNDLDGVVVEPLKNQITHLKPKDTVIVLHLHGSHGPDYYDKYPPTFRRFKPDCRKNDFRFCDKPSLINAYDNTILYTDYVIGQVIDVLKTQQAQWNTALIYTSDHGESIGEGGIYEHCTPYMMAPIEQTQVPLMVWASAAFKTEKNLSMACLQKNATEGKYAHDNLFHSILGLMDIQTSVYQKKLDLFHTCRTSRMI